MTETALALMDSPNLPDAVSRRGVTEAQWRTLCNSLFPGAKPESVLLVIDYCQARGLDPMKKPAHIVPMEVKDARTNSYNWRDVVMPGIYEYRTTAHRTGEYLGHSEPVYGPDVQLFGTLTVPEWVELTVYRWNGKAQAKVPFPVRTYFKEVVALSKDKQSQKWGPNTRWRRAPIQMLTKCCEAAALREGFPEELGGTLTEEEMHGQRSTDIDVTVEESPVPQALAALKALPEAVQDNIERAFTELRLTEAQRLQKLNEFLLVADRTADDSAQALLEWARDAFAAKKGTTRAKANGNAKPRTDTKKAEPATEPAPAEEPPPPPPTDEPREGEVLFE